MHALKNELWLVIFSSVAIIFMIYTVIFGEKQVVINKAESVLVVKRFDPKNPPKDVSPTFHGVTKWEFECPCKVKFDVVEKVNEGGGSFVRIKVRSLKADLSLPMTMWMPDNPPKGLKAHENGHVRICKTVYEDADLVAKEIAQSIIGKEYSGNGKDMEAACTFASGIAAIDFSNAFEVKVAKKAQVISEIYDYICQFNKGEAEEFVEKAFKYYESGKPRPVTEGKRVSSR